MNEELTFSPTITRRVHVDVLWVHTFSCIHQLQFQVLITHDLQLYGCETNTEKKEDRRDEAKKIELEYMDEYNTIHTQSMDENSHLNSPKQKYE